MKTKKHRIFLWFFCRSIAKLLKKEYPADFTGKIEARSSNVFKVQPDGSLVCLTEQMIFIDSFSPYSIETIQKLLKSIFRSKGYKVGEIQSENTFKNIKTIYIKSDSKKFKVVVGSKRIFPARRTIPIRIITIDEWPKE